ncbi:hypothetical protein H5410_060381 [Solanum commersonii]|uniref:Uncharacterized protein n=1 Tax=Solanum commersonii TaxID=4109 RepID=A0A9J5W5G9_SOLCO|nr:hypothetical protein H5410_060381 [Solanum commersonii]
MPEFTGSKVTEDSVNFVEELQKYLELRMLLMQSVWNWLLNNSKALLTFGMTGGKKQGRESTTFELGCV